MTTPAEGTFTEAFVEAADVRIQLRRGGTGEPLLVLHSELGVPGWLRAYALLAEHFTVYVPSLPGFGQSVCPDWIVTVRDLAAWVTWLIRDLQLPQPLPVIGCSLGGWIAAEIATMNASIFKKMVLVKLKPSAYVRRQVCATCIDDPVGVAARQCIGADNIMWSSDDPHTVSTGPPSREVVARDLRGVPEDNTQKIVWDNAARLYGFDLA